MLEIFGALFAGVYLTTLLVVLVWRPARSLRLRIGVTSIVVAWIAAVLALATLGSLTPRMIGPLPPGLAPFSILLASLLAVWRMNRRVRDALSACETHVLIAIHAFRLGGVMFVVLALAGRLAPAFAFTAGIGDMLVGAIALVLTVRLASGQPVSVRTIRVWNTLGLLDLVVAITMGVLSVPDSPLGIFGVEPGMRVMTTTPWIIVPAVIVPVLVLAHIALASRLAAPGAPVIEPGNHIAVAGKRR